MKTESTIRFFNNNSNAAFTRPSTVLPLKLRKKIRQMALDTQNSFRDGDTILVMVTCEVWVDGHLSAVSKRDQR